MNHVAWKEISFGRQFDLDEITSGIESVSPRDVARIAGDPLKGAPSTRACSAT